MRKVSLLGGSNSLKKNGLKKALSEKSILKNYALGASTSIQNLYEIIRNKGDLQDSDLIITESNVNDFHNYNELNYDISIVERNIHLLYNELAKYEAPILVLILPLQTKKYHSGTVINSLHLKYIKRYGLNYINMHDFYERNMLGDFFYFDNLDHPLDDIMYVLGSNIIDNIDTFKKHSSNKLKLDIKYQVLSSLSVDKTNKSNSILNEVVNNINRVSKVSDKYRGNIILGIHTWADENSSIAICNLTKKTLKYINSECQFHEVQKKLVIDESTALYPYKSNEIYYVEPSIRVDKKKQRHTADVGVISLFIGNLSSISKLNCLDYSVVDNNCDHLLEFILSVHRIIIDYQIKKDALNPIRRSINKHRSFRVVKLMANLYRVMKNARKIK